MARKRSNPSEGKSAAPAPSKGATSPMAAKQRKPLWGKIKHFIRNHFFSILTLLMAVVGGLPGILSTFSFLNDRPGFTFIPQIKSCGEIQNIVDGHTHTVVMVSGVVSNPGTKPLSPHEFILELNIDGSWQRLSRFYIPANL